MRFFSKLFGKENEEKKDSAINAGIAGALHETVERHGDAIKEHYIHYTGINNETGEYLKRGLKKISESKVNPDYEYANLKQQAGFSAEEKYVARQNADRILDNDPNRIVRTDDIGRVNDPLYDHVEVNSEGMILPGGEQMKFVGGSPSECLDKLASPKFEKYLEADAKITVPKDYYDAIKSECDQKVTSLNRQLESASQRGDTQLIENIQGKINKYNKIKTNVKDSGITNEEAMFAREHPFLSTAHDSFKIANKAGVQAAKTGVVVGGAFSLIGNSVKFCKGEISIEEAAKNIAKDTATAAGRSYITGAGASLLKAGMQNSSKAALRGLSKGSAPAMIVSGCIDVGVSAVKFAKGQIDGTEFMVEIGKSASNNLCAGVMASVGQVLIPVPVVGGFIGAMVGYTISNTFYTALVDSAKEAKLSKREYEQVKKDCEQLRNMILQYQKEMNAYVEQYFNDFKQVMNSSFEQMNYAVVTNDIDAYIQGANNITEYLGGEVQWRNKKEFDDFMNDESKSLIL